jgi:hypothetical protein
MCGNYLEIFRFEERGLVFFISNAVPEYEFHNTICRFSKDEASERHSVAAM